MTERPESHHRLWLAAAVASGWPVLRAIGAEAAVERALAQAEAHTGPLPQAIVDEPWEGDRYALEIALPGLGAEAALALSEAVPGAWFTPGPRPELAEQLEQGLRIDEVELVGPCTATRPVGLDGGIRPELKRSATADAAILALEPELAEALRAVDPALQTLSDRGPDTVSPVVDEATGRFGVLVSIPGETFLALD